MSFSDISTHLPKETKELPRYSDVKKCLQLWCWATKERGRFHRITLADCTGTNFLAMRIFNGPNWIRDVCIKDATGTHEYKASEEGLEEFELTLDGENSVGQKFTLKFSIRVQDKKISKQKIDLESPAMIFY